MRGVTTKVGIGRCGFAAFYAISFRFNPKSPARAIQFFFTLFHPPQIKDVRFIPKGIEEWEAKKAISRDEFEEVLSDKMAAAIVASFLRQEFQDIVFTSQDAGAVVYEDVRDKVLSIAGSRIQQASPTPMDIGAANDKKAEKCMPCHPDVWSPPSYGEGGGEE